MSPRPDLAAGSRDGHLALRRVERQHAILERLLRSAGPLTAPRLATELGVSQRTVVRDLRRLRESGVPLIVTAGPHGGVRLPRRGPIPPVELDQAEIGALIAALAAFGPTASESAGSAMRKLTATLDVDQPSGYSP